MGGPDRRRISAPVVWLSGISLLYFVCAGLRAAYRPLWYDEILTWHVARLPSIAAIWATILSGLDLQMPLMHLLVRLSHALFGPGNLGTRLPMLIGFWIAMIGIYHFLKHRLPWPYALIGMTFPMLTFAWPYAFEARAYAIALGATAMVLVSWQKAAEGGARLLALAGIAVGLAVILAVQPVLAVVAIPFALGEGVRTVDRRRVDVPIWLAFAAATPMAAVYPVIRNSMKHFSFAGSELSAFGISRFFDDALQTTIFPVLAAGLVACYIARREQLAAPAARLLPRHEAAALIGFLLTPIPFFVGGLISNQMIFFPRYGILVVVGIACLFAVFLCHVAGGNTRIANAVLVTLLLWFGAARGKEAFALAHDPVITWRENWSVLDQVLAQGLPVVVSSPLLLLEADHHLPDDRASRVYWVASEPGVEQQYGWQPFWNHYIPEEAKRFPLRAHVASWKEFAAHNPVFFLYADAQRQWWYDVLPREGWRLSMRAVQNDQTLYYVDKL